MSAFYAPDPIQSCQLIPGGNTPASGALLFVYQVGSSTKQNSYTDASASTARTNPIVLDSGGNIPGNGEVWIASSAKFVLAPSNDTDPPASPYWTRDNLPGLNNVTSVPGTPSEWIAGSTATFVGATAFSVGGDQTLLYILGRRIKASVTGGDRFGIITSSVFSGASTAVGVTLDSSTLNGGLNAVYYGILGTPNGSIPWESISSSGTNILAPISFFSVAQNESQTIVSAAASPNIWAGGDIINYMGSATTSTFSNAPQTGSRRILITNSTAVFISSAALTLLGISGASSYTAFAGDRIEVLATSTNTFSLYGNLYRKGSWTPSVGTSATYVVQSGDWLKIGELVHVWGTMHVSTIGTDPQNSTRISGLPFLSIHNAAISISNITSAATSVVYAGGFIGSQGTFIFLFSKLSASSTDTQNNLLGNNTAIRFSGSYLTNT